MSYRSPPSPTSPGSPGTTFLDEMDDVLEWINEWERQNTTLDQKHIEVLVSQWKLLRQGAKEHAYVIHQMKKAMQELRSNSAGLQDRLNAMEYRLREELHKEQGLWMESMERRQRDKEAHDQAIWEVKTQEVLREFRDRIDSLQAQLAREKQLREETKQQVADERVACERRFYQLQDRMDRTERAMKDFADQLAGMQDRCDRDFRITQHKLAAIEERVDSESRRDRGVDTTLEKLRDLVINEQQARERTFASIHHLFNEEKLAREAQGKSLVEVVKAETEERQVGLEEVRRGLSREASLRERQSEALRALEERLAQYGLSVQERMDDVLGLLQDAAGNMRRTWRGPA